MRQVANTGRRGASQADLAPAAVGHAFFASLKRAIRDAYQARVGERGGRALSTPAWVDVVTNTVYCFLQSRSWAHAFDSNGFGATQQQVSRRVLSALELEAAPEVPSSPPTVNQLRELYPRGTRDVNAALITACTASGDAPFILRIPTTSAFRACRAAYASAKAKAAARVTRPDGADPTLLRIRTTAAYRARLTARGASGAASSSADAPP